MDYLGDGIFDNGGPLGGVGGEGDLSGIVQLFVRGEVVANRQSELGLGASGNELYQLGQQLVVAALERLLYGEAVLVGDR